MPLKRLSKKESRLYVKPWITKGLLASIANKNKLYKSYLKSRNSYYLSKFKYYRNKLKHLILISKKSYYSSYFLRNKDNIKGVWKGIKELIRTKNSNNHMPTTLKIGNSKVTNRQSIVNAFNDYFGNIGPNVAKTIPVANTTPFHYMPNPLCKSFALFPVTRHEITDEINNLDASKSVGPFSVPIKLLKIIKHFLAGPLALLYNCSFATGVVPDWFKIARVVPIYKKGASVVTSNYRPISLLSVFNKLLEKLMYKRLVIFLENNSVFFNGLSSSERTFGWNVLVRARFHPVLITGDIKQAFLQVRIHQQDRDALRFHWFTDLETKTVEVLRFTRALFWLAPSPFLLGGVIQHHLENFQTIYPEIVDEIKKSLYVDDLIGGGENGTKAKQLKSKATEIFASATFRLHKWHSNVRELESQDQASSDGTETYAKQQLGVPKGNEASILGLSWNKEDNVIGVKFPLESTEQTKRGILAKVAGVYDPLGLVSPTTLIGKLQYRDACDAKLAWDAKLPDEMARRLKKWEEGLPTAATTNRSLAVHHEEIEDIQHHSFGDASGKGVGAAVYAVVTQPSGVSQGLVAAKARLAKQGLTIPRLELVSGHMAINLITDVKWRYVHTGENPADLGSGTVIENDL